MTVRRRDEAGLLLGFVDPSHSLTTRLGSDSDNVSMAREEVRDPRRVARAPRSRNLPHCESGGTPSSNSHSMSRPRERKER